MRSSFLTSLRYTRAAIVLRTIGRSFRRKRPLSAASRLPQEIVGLIFEYYLPSVTVLPMASPFDYSGPLCWTASEGEDFISLDVQRSYEQLVRYKDAVREALSSLHSATSVCRSWYLAGTEYLYRHPILMSYRQTRALDRVLTKHPNAQLARDLIVFLQEDHYYKSERLLSILNNSDSLDTLVVIHDINEFTLSTFDYRFDTKHSFSSRLRKLTIHGGSWACEMKLPLPALEHLCLQNTWLSLLGEEIFEGDLPRLHTLQLVDVYFGCAKVLLTSLSKLRSLRVLELFLVKPKTLQDFFMVNDISLPQLQHLTVGILDSSIAPLGSWRFPPNLITMTLLVNVLPRRETGEVICDGPMGAINNFILFNTDQMVPGKSFKKLLLVNQLDFNNTANDPVSEAVADHKKFLKGEEEQFKKARNQYFQLLRVTHSCRIPLVPIWCDLAAFVNDKLAHPFRRQGEDRKGKLISSWRKTESDDTQVIARIWTTLFPSLPPHHTSMAVKSRGTNQIST